MLTIEDLQRFSPGIFASGEDLIEHPWFNDAKKISEGGNLEEDGRSVKVKWCAVRGNIADWAIYHSLDANLEPSPFLDGTTHLMADFGIIARAGAKLTEESNIKRLVPCDDEVFKMYRY